MRSEEEIMKEIKITTPVKFRHMIFPGLKVVLHNGYISLISYTRVAELDEFILSEKEAIKLKKIIEKWFEYAKNKVETESPQLRKD